MMGSDRAGRGRPTVLVVSANDVCRAPTVGLLLSRATCPEGGSPLFAVRTAGVEPALHAGWCEEAAARVGAGAGAGALASTHRASRLDRTVVEQAKLILTTGRAERAEVARRDPQASMRAFTLREAAALATVLLAVREGGPEPAGFVSVPPPASGDADEAMAWLSGQMNELRGVWRPLVRRRSLRFRGTADEGYDLPDAHRGDRHRRAVAVASDSASVLGLALTDLTRAVGGAGAT